MPATAGSRHSLLTVNIGDLGMIGIVVRERPGGCLMAIPEQGVDATKLQEAEDDHFSGPVGPSRLVSMRACLANDRDGLLADRYVAVLLIDLDVSEISSWSICNPGDFHGSDVLLFQEVEAEEGDCEEVLVLFWEDMARNLSRS